MTVFGVWDPEAKLEEAGCHSGRWSDTVPQLKLWRMLEHTRKPVYVSLRFRIRLAAIDHGFTLCCTIG